MQGQMFDKNLKKGVCILEGLAIVELIEFVSGVEHVQVGSRPCSRVFASLQVEKFIHKNGKGWGLSILLGGGLKMPLLAIF